jgi:hypothetical protein
VHLRSGAADGAIISIADSRGIFIVFIVFILVVDLSLVEIHEQSRFQGQIYPHRITVSFQVRIVYPDNFRLQHVPKACKGSDLARDRAGGGKSPLGFVATSWCHAGGTLGARWGRALVDAKSISILGRPSSAHPLGAAMSSQNPFESVPLRKE